MTVLSAVQDAARLLTLTVPTVLYGSTEKFSVTMQSLCTESAKSIAKQHDWRKLITLKTQAGNGSATAFNLPSDYDRMPVKASVFLTSATRPLTPVTDLDEWMQINLQTVAGTVGWWILLGASLQVLPAVAASDSIKYYYVSDLIITDLDDITKTHFTQDDDVFNLPERLLTLDLIWRYLQREGLEYAEDMQNFEIALAQEITRDKGSRMIKVGRARMPADAQLAYPGTISA